MPPANAAAAAADATVRFSLPAAIADRIGNELLHNQVKSDVGTPRSASETCIGESLVGGPPPGGGGGSGGGGWRRKKTELGWFIDEIRRLAHAEESRQDLDTELRSDDNPRGISDVNAGGRSGGGVTFDLGDDDQDSTGDEVTMAAGDVNAAGEDVVDIRYSNYIGSATIHIM
jgi:hypothetical protein